MRNGFTALVRFSWLWATAFRWYFEVKRSFSFVVFAKNFFLIAILRFFFSQFIPCFTNVFELEMEFFISWTETEINSNNFNGILISEIRIFYAEFILLSVEINIFHKINLTSIVQQRIQSKYHRNNGCVIWFLYSILCKRKWLEKLFYVKR